MLDVLLILGFFAFLGMGVYISRNVDISIKNSKHNVDFYG
jgi:hypothetical protein